MQVLNYFVFEFLLADTSEWCLLLPYWGGGREQILKKCDEITIIGQLASQSQGYFPL
jgi:hypothetical protein